METDHHAIPGPTLGDVQTVIIPADMIAELEAMADATPVRGRPWTKLEVSILREYKDRIPRDRLTDYINAQCGNNRTRGAVDHKSRNI